MSSLTSKPKIIKFNSSQIMHPKPGRVRKIKNGKDFIHKIPKKLNLELISLNEIEKDFNEIKSKNEQKELIYLIKKAKKCKINKNKTANYLGPEKPLLNDFNNFNNFEIVI